MNCDRWREIALDMARGAADAAVGEQARAHTESCASCAAHLREQLELTAALQTLARSTAVHVPSERLERRLVEAIDKARSVSSDNAGDPSAGLHLRTRPGIQRRTVFRWLPAAAALALVAAMLAWWQRPAPSSPAVPTSPHAHNVALPSAETREADDRNAERRPVGPSGRGTSEPPDLRTFGPSDRGASARTRLAAEAGRAARPSRRTTSPPLVQATGFVSLPGAATLPAMERGEILRVQISLASLASLGFTVQPDAADTTPIDADLLVGQDGQPRAIRLVTTDGRDSRSRR